MIRVIRQILVLTALFSLLVAGVSHAQAPVVNYPTVVVKGTLTDKAGTPLSGLNNNGQYAWIGLYRVDPSDGMAHYVNGSDCYGYQSLQGCPNVDGSWSFSTDYNGTPLPQGQYRIDGEATNFLGKWKRVNAPQTEPVAVKLDRQPVVIDWYKTGCEQYITNNMLNCTLFVKRNVDIKDDARIRFEVQQYLSGPGATSSYVNVPLPKREASIRNGSALKFNIEVPKSAQDGFMYCLYLVLGHDEWHTWTSVSMCGIKPAQ